MIKYAKLTLTIVKFELEQFDACRNFLEITKTPAPLRPKPPEKIFTPDLRAPGKVFAIPIFANKNLQFGAGNQKYIKIF